MASQIDSGKFAFQLVARGSFVDDAAVPGESFLVETFTIRLNHVALNAWLLSRMDNVRECYETDEEWEAHKAECQWEQTSFKCKIVEALEINPWAGSVCITQALTDVFTVVHIRKLQ